MAMARSLMSVIPGEWVLLSSIENLKRDPESLSDWRTLTNEASYNLNLLLSSRVSFKSWQYFEFSLLARDDRENCKVVAKRCNPKL